MTTNRLVVELSDKAQDALTQCSYRDQMNKTTVTNRAVLLYEIVTGHQHSGGSIMLTFPDGRAETLRLL